MIFTPILKLIVGLVGHCLEKLTSYAMHVFKVKNSESIYQEFNTNYTTLYT